MNFIIGIVSNVGCNPFLSGVCHDKHYRYWLNHSYGGKLRNHVTACYENKEYGKDVVNGDIICMELDLKDCNVSFYVNNENQGIAFKNVEIGEDIDYRLIVSLAVNGTSVSIIKFTQQY